MVPGEPPVATGSRGGNVKGRVPRKEERPSGRSLELAVWKV